MKSRLNAVVCHKGTEKNSGATHKMPWISVMPKYRKKPVAVDAYQLGGHNTPDWFMDAVTDQKIILHNDPISAEIITLEGVMKAQFQDYIIRGVKGEIYPCKPDIFEATYELAE